MSEDVSSTVSEFGRVTSLQIGHGRISLTTTSRDGGSAETHDAGALRTILNHLHHEPPTPVELEYAIAEIEDAVMPVLRLLPERTRLVAKGREFDVISRLLNSDHVTTSRVEPDRVEALFNRLANISYGAPSSHAGFPSHREFAVALLVLREVIHHGQFGSVTFE